MDRLVLLCLVAVVLDLVDTLSYSVRIAGVRTKRLALSLSLFNSFALIFRTARAVEAPLTGVFVDAAKSTGAVHVLVTQLRWVLLASTVGTLIGIVLVPTFVRLLSVSISKLEEAGSIGEFAKRSMRLVSLKRVGGYVGLPKHSMISRLRVGGVSKRLFLLSALTTGIFTTGALSCMLAAAMYPSRSTTLTVSSGLVNGLATVMLALAIDPQVAILTDQVIVGRKPVESVNKMVGVLLASRLVGTLLAQALLVPTATWIIYATGLF